MLEHYKFKNLKGYIILLISFIIFMIIKELEVRAIKKAINGNPEIVKTP
tara:strand:- start:1609 stop:1755 length:147 start_codon:yes stop_codon:yes gene_type:complete